MRQWISKWVMFVAVGHTVVAMMFFGDTYSELIQSGLFNAVQSEKVGLAVWFFFFGFLLFLAAMLLAEIEKNESTTIPKSFGIALLVLTTLGVILMPISGFWLVFPAVFVIVFKPSKKHKMT